jgi:dihydroorotase
MTELRLTQPDDLHVHFRDGDYLATTVPATARQFARAIAMPNLAPAVTTLEAITAYRQRIMAQVPAGVPFQPLMTLYLTDHTEPALILEGARQGLIHGCKLYPAGATTHSHEGVTDIRYLDAVLQAMSDSKIPLLLHGEVTDPAIDVFDREARFIDKVLTPLLLRFPALKIILEHITTEEAVQCVQQGPATLAATITPHHLLLNRNDLLVGSIKPHYYCLPILKRAQHQQALIKAAISGNPKFFLGTDSAPHVIHKKESSHGCAGIYSAHAAIEFYAEVFEQYQALSRLEGFSSHFGADFYGLPRNTKQIILEQEDWEVPAVLSFGNDSLKPFWAGQTLRWRLRHDG